MKKASWIFIALGITLIVTAIQAVFAGGSMSDYTVGAISSGGCVLVVVGAIFLFLARRPAETLEKQPPFDPFQTLAQMRAQMSQDGGTPTTPKLTSDQWKEVWKAMPPLHPGSTELRDKLLEKLTQAGVITQLPSNLQNFGVQAKGVIMSARPTGNILGDSAEMELKIMVTRPDGSQYEATPIKKIPPMLLPMMQTGRVVQIYYMPDDEQNVTLKL